MCHFGIDGNRRKRRIRQVGIGFDFRVSESEDGKAGLIHVQAILADVIDPLGDASVLIAVTGIKVGLGKVSVFIQGFAVPQGDFLPRFGVQPQLGVARQILTEINNSLAVGSRQDPSGEPLLFQNRNGIGADKLVKTVILHADTMPVGYGFHPGIIGFTFFHIIQANGAGLAGFPAAV